MSDRLDDLKAATRPAFFETGWDGWEYATSGGTVFLVSLEGKPYAITATHVRQSFEWKQLCLTGEKYGREIAGLKSAYRADELFGDAEGTDIGDITIIEFADGLGAEFFQGQIYDLDQVTTGRSDTGDALIAYGNPKELINIEDGKIKPIFMSLGFVDVGPHPHDLFLRNGIGQWNKPGITSLTGMSGCAIFNTAKNVLCGVMIRGGLKDGEAKAKFIDIDDVVTLLRAIHAGEKATSYRKTVKLPVPST